MKDIDFDELDRAVSSVLGTAAPKPEDQATDNTATAPVEVPASSTEEQPAHASATSQAEEPAEVDTTTAESSEPAQTATAEPVKTTPLAVKRRGKFMDVVHPSLDMNVKPVAMPSATRKTLSPLSEPSLDDQKVEATEQDINAAEVNSVVRTNNEAESSQSESDAVSGSESSGTETSVEATVEIATVSDETVETVTAESAAYETEKSEQVADASPETTDAGTESETSTLAGAVANEQPQAETEPAEQTASFTLPTVGGAGAAAATLETPFLSDAKVEKRPLGGFGEVDSTEKSSEEPGPEDNAPADDTQAPPEVSLPRELQADVVKVEAIHDDTRSPEVADAAAPTVATVPSINAEVEQTHSLFDTSSYHEPIAPGKKSSVPSWVWWLVGLLVCLASGAGVGYFLFVVGL